MVINEWQIQAHSYAKKIGVQPWGKVIVCYPSPPPSPYPEGGMREAVEGPIKGILSSLLEIEVTSLSI